MIRTLLSRFRRKPPTPQEGRAIIEDAIRKTLEKGLTGYVFADFSKPDFAGEFTGTINAGSLGIGVRLNKFLGSLLADKDTHDVALAAIVAALQDSGSAREVRMVPVRDDCDCSLCTARRAKEGERQPTSKPH